MTDNISSELMSYMQNHKIINTHSHHLEDHRFETVTLDNLLSDTYVNWSGVQLPETPTERTAYLKKVQCRSYFIWLQKALQDLYGFSEPISADNWDSISQLIETSHQDSRFHLDVLQQKCGYRKVILDAYWRPGSDNGHAGFFTPALRVNSFFFGYSNDSKDHNGNNCRSLYGIAAQNIDDYAEAMKTVILQKQKQGCIALKCALAYDRDLNFQNADKAQANRALTCTDAERTPEDIRVFQNYLFQKICEISAGTGLPLQCHTGLGLLQGSQAINLTQAIARNPDTKFVLLHCGFPWTDDISGLLHNYTNVYPDLSWLPILSPTAAKQMINQLIELGNSDKVCWGCDTWTSEESYGALLAFRQVLTAVLSEKIQDGYFLLDDAKRIIDCYLYDNAAGLYQI